VIEMPGPAAWKPAKAQALRHFWPRAWLASHLAIGPAELSLERDRGHGEVDHLNYICSLCIYI
jgi:hypothetical protein